MSGKIHRAITASNVVHCRNRQEHSRTCTAWYFRDFKTPQISTFPKLLYLGALAISQHEAQVHGSTSSSNVLHAVVKHSLRKPETRTLSQPPQCSRAHHFRPPPSTVRRLIMFRQSYILTALLQSRNLAVVARGGAKPDRCDASSTGSCSKSTYVYSCIHTYTKGLSTMDS